MSTARETELDSFRLQAEEGIQDAAEARSGKGQLERAINQYEKILDAIGITRGVKSADGNAAGVLGGAKARMTTTAPRPANGEFSPQITTDALGQVASVGAPAVASVGLLQQQQAAAGGVNGLGDLAQDGLGGGG